MKTTITRGLAEVGRGQTISPRKPQRRLMRTSMSTSKTMVRSMLSCLQRPITEESTSENKVLIVCVYIQSKCAAFRLLGQPGNH